MLKLIDLDFDNISNDSYNLTVLYYTLKDDKVMGDGSIFKKGTILRRLLRTGEDGFLFVEKTGGRKFLFWVKEEEINFLEEKEEDWSKTDLKIISKFIFNDFL